MMIDRVWFGLGILLLMSCENVLSWRSFKIIFELFTYEFESEVADVKAEIRNTTTGERALNMIINLKQDILDGQIHAVIGMQNEEGNYTVLANRTGNLCQVLNSRLQQSFMRILFDDLSKHGNFFKTCPIKKGTYTLTDYQVDEEILPSYVPETMFYLALVIDVPKTGIIFNSTLTGYVDKTKGFNNLKMFSLG